MKLKTLFGRYNKREGLAEVFVYAEKLRDLGLTPEIIRAIAKFDLAREKLKVEIYYPKEKRIINAALYDYAIGLKGLDDEADMFEGE